MKSNTSIKSCQELPKQSQFGIQLLSMHNRLLDRTQPLNTEVVGIERDGDKIGSKQGIPTALIEVGRTVN